MKRHLRLVGTHDPADIFSDLDALRAQAPSLQPPPKRREKIDELFARIPYDRALDLYGKIDAAAWIVLIELDRQVLKGRGLNPVVLGNDNLRKIGMTAKAQRHALQQLAAADVIKLQLRHSKPPLVLHTWYPCSALEGLS
jgi:hypothetical protein